jgi:hypothetical protein
LARKSASANFDRRAKVGRSLARIAKGALFSGAIFRRRSEIGYRPPDFDALSVARNLSSASNAGVSAVEGGPHGDAANAQLRSAIRAHAHFAEYVPIIALMVMTLEMSGLPETSIHGLMGTLLVARLLHPFGMYAKPAA